MSSPFDKLCSVRSRLADDIVALCDAVIEKLDTTGYSFNNNGTTEPIKISTTVIDARVFTREKEPGRDKDGEDEWSAPTPHERALAELNEITQLAGEQRTKPWSRVFSEAKAGRPLVVIGAPGGGKTTLSCHSVLQRLDAVGKALRNHTSLPEETFPALWTTCTSLAECTGATEDVTALVINAAFHTLGLPPESKARSPRVRGWLRTRIESGKCPLVIDSLDELEEKNRGSFQSRAPRLLDLDSPVVLTCRVVEWGQRRSWAGWKGKDEGPFELASLDAREQRHFMERFFNEGIKRPERLAGMRKVLSASQALRRTCESPILLFFSCLIHGEHELEGTLRRTDLYNLIRRRLFLGEWKEVRYTPSWVDGKDLEDDVTDWLAEIALALFRDRPETKVFSSDQWRVAASSPEAVKVAAELPADITARALLTDLERCGFLVFARRSAQDRSLYSFTHRSFFACLAGRALARREPSVYQREVIEHLWFEPAWEDVILFLAGHLDEAGADALLTEIRKQPEDIFFERLRWEWRIGGEAVSLPEQCGENWGKFVAELAGSAKFGLIPKRLSCSDRTALVHTNSRSFFYNLGAATRAAPSSINFLLMSLDPKRATAEERRNAVVALGEIGDLRAVDRLLQCLDPKLEGDPQTRQNAVFALTSIGGDRAMFRVLQSLDPEFEPDPHIRSMVRLCLVKIECPQAVDWSLQLLDPKLELRENMRISAVRILKEIGDDRAVDGLIRSLDPEFEPEADVRNYVAESLGSIGDTRAVDRLLQSLDPKFEENFLVRSKAAGAIRTIGDARALDKLLQSLDPEFEPESYVRIRAVESLGRFRDARAVDALLRSLDTEFEPESDVRRSAVDTLGLSKDARAVDRLLQILDPESEPRVELRACAADALGRIGDARPLDRLLQSLDPESESESFVRLRVALALVEIGDARAVDSLLQSLDPEFEPEACVRECIIDGLWRFGDARTVDGLIKSLNTDREHDWYLRWQVADALGRIGDVRAVDGLIHSLNLEFEPNSHVRAYVAGALGRIGDPKAVDRLLRSLDPKSEPESNMRRVAAAALGEIGDTRAVDRLLQILDPESEPDSAVRSAAAEAIGRIGDTRAIDRLLQSLDPVSEADSSVRTQVASALEGIGDERALETLLQSLDPARESDKGVRKAATNTLQRIYWSRKDRAPFLWAGKDG
jgi:HEAT repeat protein